MSDVHEVAPLAHPPDARVRPPGSKSSTIRALFMASLARGSSVLRRPLDAEDTVAARSALRRLGVEIDDGGKDWVVEGRGGALTSSIEPVDVGASGLTARTMIAVASLVPGTTTIVGRDRLPERPMGGVVSAMRRLGVDVESRDGRLPVVVRGTGALEGGEVVVEAGETTQSVTAVLVVAPLARAPVTVVVEGMIGSQGYVGMTVGLMADFGARVDVADGAYRVATGGYRGSEIIVEPDASAAVYPMVAAAVTRGKVTVEGLAASSLQPDVQVASHLEAMGCRVAREDDGITVDARGVDLRGIDADLSASPDGAVALAVAAAFASGESRLRRLGSLRLKESDRLAALVTELHRIGCGAAMEEDDLIVTPAPLRPARIETYRDHRIAMSFALAGLVVPGVMVGEPGVVAKTWPGFWDFLAELRRTGAIE